MKKISHNNVLLLLMMMVSVWMASCQSGSDNKNWSSYRSDLNNSAYSPLDQIDTTNVQDLKVAWTYHTGDADSGNRSAIQCNPLLANGSLFITSPKLKLIALEPNTGKERWRFDPFQGATATGVNRGVTYWENQNDRRIYFSAGVYLYAINADNGVPVDDFGQHGKIDLRENLDRDPATLSVWATSPGVIYDGLIIQGTALGEGYDAAPGYVRAYDVYTGKLKWTFHTIPHPGEPGYDTWPDGAYKEVGAANSWAGMSLDTKAGIVYIPTGSPAFDFYGGNRRGPNLYGNSLIALEATTGKVLWHYQLVHHDLWDYDLPAPPNLVKLHVDGKDIDAVAQVTKMGMIFLFDRHSGIPVFPIEERPVPPSTLLGEEVWGTQPFPTLPLPIVRHHFSDDQITDISGESRAYVATKILGARYGDIYNPPGTEGVVQLPGTRGGSEWGGAAVNPNTGIMYVNANEIPLLVKMKQLDDASSSDVLAIGQKLYTLNNCTMCHGADRAGTPGYPSLKNIKGRISAEQISSLLRKGRGQMPAFPNVQGDDLKSLLAFLMDEQSTSHEVKDAVPDSAQKKVRYVHNGWNVLTDQNGYPGIKPPWGTLNAVDLNTGELLWKKVLGEYPELIAKGLPPTGTQNLGGPAITAGGLIFIGATRDEKFRAFDQRTGKILWEYKLPAGGYATPSVYAVDGHEYVVIAAGGGGKIATPSSDTYVAFTLPR